MKLNDKIKDYIASAYWPIIYMLTARNVILNPSPNKKTLQRLYFPFKMSPVFTNHSEIENYTITACSYYQYISTNQLIQLR